MAPMDKPDDLLARATAGEELPVDSSSIEKTLTELWRTKKDGDSAVTRAALWNVVAHTTTSAHQSQASEVLSRASAAVPQRTIIIRADPAAPAEMTSWISANCHLIGEGKQVCSEEIAIVAGGERVQRVPPLVAALLIPDMPLALWWMGDLPDGNAAYVESLLEPADRLIVDSAWFDSPADLALVARLAANTTTLPADLNWIRLDEWRAAAAAVFDPPAMRPRLKQIRAVKIVANGQITPYFGDQIESLYFASWLSVQLGHEVGEEGKVEGAAGAIDYRFETRPAPRVDGIATIEISFTDGGSSLIQRDGQRGVITTNVGGIVSVPDGITRTLARQTHELIVRQLKQPEGDRMLLKVLPLAARLARRIAA